MGNCIILKFVTNLLPMIAKIRSNDHTPVHGIGDTLTMTDTEHSLKKDVVSFHESSLGDAVNSEEIVMDNCRFVRPISVETIYDWEARYRGEVGVEPLWYFYDPFQIRFVNERVVDPPDIISYLTNL